ncbi:hypothetical protein [Vibrio sp. MEBiC08052]|uniref:hypothetical protein n=1 Tax=Vibrio sp. MEBiC08052 TaxID=1761910 RepID=UPI0007407138|nr:hypothetical protein [Vibrio sp. MEBiC08052]KUI97857.1 hypothetical protein VRK_25580 [Vibrio sp. MEBiC08052]
MKRTENGQVVDYTSFSYTEMEALAHELRSDKIKLIEQNASPKTYEFTELELTDVHQRLKTLEVVENIVLVKEGYTTRVKSTQIIRYPGIDSCLAVTITLSSGDKVGGHFVMTEPGTSPYTGPEMINRMKDLVGQDTVSAITFNYKPPLGWDKDYKNMLDVKFDWDDQNLNESVIDALKTSFNCHNVQSTAVGGDVNK